VINGLGNIAIISAGKIFQLGIRQIEPLAILAHCGEIEEDPFHGFGRMADRALEILEMELLLGQPLMPVLRVALKADSYSLLLGELLEGGSSMGIMAFEAEPVADLGMFALAILADDFFMALRTVDHAGPLRMGKCLDISMTINALQLSVDRGTKPLNVHIECKLPLFYLLFAGSRSDHLEPLFSAHLEYVTVSVTFETCLVTYRKGHPRPCKERKKYKKDEFNSEQEAGRPYPILFICTLGHRFFSSYTCMPSLKLVLFVTNCLFIVKIKFVHVLSLWSKREEVACPIAG
jgi:hypothetical protein